jgi:antitoxin (DNA-binding transcriptional repressor) of toxin-antitoxin stability system
MSHSMTIAQASAQLGQLILGLAPGDEIVLTENDLPVAKIVPGPGKKEPNTPPKQRMPGAWKGKLIPLDETETGILEMFKDYAP